MEKRKRVSCGAMHPAAGTGSGRDLHSENYAGKCPGSPEGKHDEGKHAASGAPAQRMPKGSLAPVPLDGEARVPVYGHGGMHPVPGKGRAISGNGMRRGQTGFRTGRKGAWRDIACRTEGNAYDLLSRTASLRHASCTGQHMDLSAERLMKAV